MFVSILIALALCGTAFLLNRAFLGPLNTIPGPYICRFTSTWLWYHSYIGDECSIIDNLHRIYGPVVRIGPNEAVISDGAALASIYTEKGGFAKAPCYSNFDIEGHSTIFSTLDPSHRAVRSKAVLPMFSLSNVRAGQDKIDECVARFIQRFKQDAAASKEARISGRTLPVNVQNLTRSLALDAVSSYLFGKTYGGINEQTNKLSATAFVDTLVAVGRFFFMPTWLFLSIDMFLTKLSGAQAEDESAHKVDTFVEKLVREETKVDTTYQGRLLKVGISEHETEVQCKDLIFAGTDSTGTNLATICWHLARRPDVYERLRKEVAEADAVTSNYNPQTLPYLDAVVKEGLRLAMANPTRLPRTTPPQGFSFQAKDGQQYTIPGGTQVGIQIYTLHFNSEVFADPRAFKPERWLANVIPEMQRDFIPFGLGSRQCIARNLATMELLLATRAIAREDVLQGAKPVGEEIRLLEWFNSSVVGEKVEVVWQ